MDWIILLASGVMEAVWATALGASDGLRRLRPTVVFVIGAVLSLVGLGIALQRLPAGTAYAVWTATGATLTLAYGMWRGTEPVSWLRIGLILGIVACVVGLKVIA